MIISEDKLNAELIKIENNCNYCKFKETCYKPDNKENCFFALSSSKIDEIKNNIELLNYGLNKNYNCEDATNLKETIQDYKELNNMIINKEQLKEQLREQLKTSNALNNALNCNNCEYYQDYCKYDDFGCGFTIKDEILNKIIESINPIKTYEFPYESNKTTYELIDELLKENIGINQIKEAITDYNTAYTNYKNRLNQFKMVYNKKENDLNETLEKYFKGADIRIDEKTIYIKYYHTHINPYTILKDIQPIIKSYKIATDHIKNETKIKINI